MKTTGVFFALCVLAAATPFCSGPRAAPSLHDGFPGWAVAPGLHDVTALELGPREARFAADFPGQIGAFTDGQQTFIVRWVTQPTRKLHPASDCLRALGYTVKPAPIFVATDATTWGAHFAQHGTDKLRVRERIVDTNGKGWTDISRWYWSALLGRTSPPWWTITVLELEK
jgi:hypothetical protein